MVATRDIIAIFKAFTVVIPFLEPLRQSLVLIKPQGSPCINPDINTNSMDHCRCAKSAQYSPREEGLKD